MPQLYQHDIVLASEDYAVTKQEFRQKMDDLTKQINALTGKLGDMLPDAINQTKWVTEAEVPVHIFLWIAQNFAEGMEELQTWFE